MSIIFCGHKLGPQNKISKIRSLPYAFTEQGVAMLATIIRTDIAAAVSIKIMDAFVEMRKFLINNGQIFERLTNVEIYTKSNTKLNANDVNKFNLQYPKLEVKYTEVFHDRFLILDKKYIYHIGASIKDVGKKCFGITLIKYDAIIKDILSRL